MCNLIKIIVSEKHINKNQANIHFYNFINSTNEISINNLILFVQTNLIVNQIKIIPQSKFRYNDA